MMARLPRMLTALAVVAAGAGVSLARGANKPTEQRRIVFFGDSLTAGYGLADPDQQSYPARVQAKIDAAGLPWKVINAGLSGETSAGGLRRVDWVLSQKPDIFVLELGGNDGLRGVPLDSTRSNLQAIVDHVRSRWPATVIVIAGMRMPPNMGEDYTAGYAAIFPTISSRNHLTLIPFLLAPVAGNPDLNQADGIHPNAAGATLVADTVWGIIAPLLRN